VTGSVVALVLFGALLHALWNALIKSGHDKALDTALIHSLGVVIALPVLALTGLPAPASWPFLATSLLRTSATTPRSPAPTNTATSASPTR
jgi:hypothetical protein